LHFAPYLALISSIDYDHPDTYPTDQDYADAFRQFAIGSMNVVSWSDQRPEIFNDLSQVRLLDPATANQNIKITGIANRRNASLVQAGLNQLGITDNTDTILSNFPGTDRRFEKLAENLYDDYGHHPVEIAATLQRARELSDHVVLVYQPHQNIRQTKIRDSYTNQFELADTIYWLPTYLTREDPNLPILKPEELFQNTTNKASFHAAEFDDDLWAKIQDARSKGVLVLAMGAGKIDGWIRQKLAESNNL
jgi:UDP-N-acetylmuramate--alanine ligase